MVLGRGRSTSPDTEVHLERTKVTTPKHPDTEDTHHSILRLVSKSEFKSICV